MSEKKPLPKCLQPMTPEELRRHKPLTYRQIYDALVNGSRNARKAQEAMNRAAMGYALRRP